MPIALALASAVALGVGGFFGGLAARRGPVMASAFGTDMVGLVVALAITPLLGGDPSETDLMWGLLSGTFAGFGLLMFYRGMAISHMAIVAPVTAVSTAIFPAVVGLATGEKLATPEIIGGLLALLAVWLVSRSDNSELQGSIVAGTTYGLLGGLCFGGLLIGMAQLTSGAGFLPLALMHLTGALVLAILAVSTRRSLSVRGLAVRPVILTGTLRVVGNALFIVAVREGPLALLAILATLHPAVVAILARIFLREPLPPTRITGLALALTAVGLISVT